MLTLYGMLPHGVSGDSDARTLADNQTVLILVYPMTTGRNFDEVLRVIDSLQLTAAHKEGSNVRQTSAIGRYQRGLAVLYR